MKQSIVSGLIGGRVARGLAIGASLAQGSGAVHVNVEASLNQLKLSTALIAIPLTTQLLHPGQDFETDYQNMYMQTLAPTTYPIHGAGRELPQNLEDRGGALEDIPFPTDAETDANVRRFRELQAAHLPASALEEACIRMRASASTSCWRGANMPTGRST